MAAANSILMIVMSQMAAGTGR